MTNLIHTCFILQYVNYNPLHVSSITCSSSGGWIVLIQHLVSSLSVSGRPVHKLRGNCRTVQSTQWPGSQSRSGRTLWRRKIWLVLAWMRTPDDQAHTPVVIPVPLAAVDSVDKWAVNKVWLIGSSFIEHWNCSDYLSSEGRLICQ